MRSVKGLFYKEWLSVRWKLFAMAFIYLAVGFITYNDWLTSVNSYHAGYDYPPYQPFFSRWLGMALYVTLGLAVLGGADTVAGEKSKGTLGFLLTKPISRTSIYLTKLAVNVGLLAVTLLGSSLIMFGLDQFHNTRDVYANISDTQAGVVAIIPNPVTAPDVAFITVIGLFGLGLFGLFLSALISIASHTTIVTIILSLVTILGVLFFLSYLNDNFLHTSMDLIPWLQQPLFNFFEIILAGSLLLAGLISFRRRAF